MGDLLVDPHIDELSEKYKEYEKVVQYLKNLRDDILENIFLFYMDEEELKDKYR